MILKLGTPCQKNIQSTNRKIKILETEYFKIFTEDTKAYFTIEFFILFVCTNNFHSADLL